MANYASGVNPALLSWARERAGYSIEQVAVRLKKDRDLIEQWEAGDAIPTYSQLERLAYVLYKRPVALFFFPEPPVEPDPHRSFRTLPDFEVDSLSPDTRLAIRQALARQFALRELTGGRNPSARMILRDIHIGPHTDAMEGARAIRGYLGVTLEEQVGWKGSADQALERWRRIVQECGVFVFKRAFAQKDVSGFSLLDSEFPVIYLNNGTPGTRQLFTLFHELAHLLLSTSGVTKRSDRYIDALVGDARDTEVLCNRLAAECLVPSDDFDRHWDRGVAPDRLAEQLAAYYKVSREVILRKLLDRRIVDRDYYEREVDAWLAQYRAQRAAMTKGGNYYATQLTYLGDSFLNLAFGRYFQGACTAEQLAEYLDVNVRTLPGLEQSFLAKAVAE